jgi:hypothetical protein
VSRFFSSVAGLAAILVLTGCANSGPVPIGPDTYMMANTGAWSWSSGAALQGDLYREANAFCAASGKKLITKDSRHNDSAMGFDAPFAHAEVQFMCLDADDPQLRRPNVRFKQAPTVVIENRQERD